MSYIHIALSAMKGDVAERQKGFKKEKRGRNKRGKEKRMKMRIKGEGGIRNIPCE